MKIYFSVLIRMIPPAFYHNNILAYQFAKYLST